MAKKDKKTQTTTLDYGTFSDRIEADINRFGRDEDQWSYARNAVLASPVNDTGDISNEQSNYLYVEVKYYKAETFTEKNENIKIIGLVHIQSDEWAVFSTDNINSEIGLFKSSEQSYVKIVNDKQLNFSTAHLITGVARINHKCGRRVYWDDGLNPSRVLDIDDVPYKKDCKTVDSCRYCENKKELDVEKIRLAQIAKPMSFKLSRGDVGGKIVNGAYFVVGAYLIDGQKISDYSLPSNTVYIYTHENAGGSLNIEVENCDSEEFDEFELILLQYTNMSPVAYRIGKFSTRQSQIVLDNIDNMLENIQVGDIMMNNPIVDKSDSMFRNGDYLFRIGTTSKLDFNYQPLANQIKTQWVSVEYPMDYYKNGGSNVGYMRDEVYAFFIRWVYNTGDRSNLYHIPGRAAKESDLVKVNNSHLSDVFEEELENQYPVWKVKNTATVENLDVKEIAEDGVGVIIARGDMAYWESTERYDDDKPEVWNASSDTMWQKAWTKKDRDNYKDYDLCGKNIRHHKFPANDTDESFLYSTNHYNPKDLCYVVEEDSAGNKTIVEKVGKTIRVMGVEFSNIKPPLDNDGNIIDNIIGYEIYRGNRYGNKSVIAKGIFNNLREYKETKNDGNTYLYPNYPYNALNGIYQKSKALSSVDENYEYGVDHFLTQDLTSFNKSQNSFKAYLTNDTPLGVDKGQFVQNDYRIGNVRTDLLTFHSPDTMFRSPYITAKEIDVYGVAKGTMRGFFKVPEGTPKQKLLTDSGFSISTIIGLGYAIIKMLGSSKRTTETPQIDYGGTTGMAGMAGYQSTGLAGTSAVSAAVMTAMNGVATAANTLVSDMLTKGILTPIMLSTGVNPENLNTAIQSFTSMLSGAIGGKGGKTGTTKEDTEWSSTPFLVRALNSFPIFANYWAAGVDKTMEMVYSWIPYRYYVLQQMSHGFYDEFSYTSDGSRRKKIKHSEYIGTNIQNFSSSYVVNNLNRTRTVGIELEEPLPINEVAIEDNSQATLLDAYGTYGSSLNWGNPENFRKNFTRDIASYYGALKQRIDNQYGQLNGILTVPICTKYYDKPTGFISSKTSYTPALFGGDIYIGRYTELNNMQFFYDWQDGEPDGTGYDYKLSQNVLHPRFWMDANKFDPADFIGSISSIFGGDSGAGTFNAFLTNPIYTEEGGALPQSKWQETIAEAKSIYQLKYPEISWTDDDIAKEIGKYPIKECDCESWKSDKHAGENNGLQICYYTSTKKLNRQFKKVCKASSALDQALFDQAMLEAAACWAHKSIKMHKYGENKDDECQPCNSEKLALADFIDDEYKGMTKKDMSKWGRKKYDKITSNSKRWKKQRDRYNCDDAGTIVRILRRAQNKVKKAQKKYDKAQQKLQDIYSDVISGKNSHNFIDKIKDKVLGFPSDKFALDMRQIWTKFNFGVSGGYMYLFNSGVRDFFVESEINIDLRDYGVKREERFYDHTSFTDLEQLFATKNIKNGNFLKYDFSYSVNKMLYQYVSWAQMQTTDYDPQVSESCYVYRPNRITYSLPQFLEGKKDNWRVFLPFNYKEFTSRPTSIKQFGKMSALITFETESPVYFDAVDSLTTDAGKKVTYGDAGIFHQNSIAQNMSQSELAHEYGACKDRLSVINTPFGVYYISQDQGKVFEATYGSALEEKSLIGLNSWFYHYLPYQLLKDKELFYDTEFELVNNPVVGIGCQSIYDNSTQTIYFCKKDYRMRSSYVDNFKYVGNGIFRNKTNGIKVKLGDSKYFEDASWTISYNPLTKYGSFVSWHDWHPDLVIPSKDTFMTIKNNGIWMHNDNCQSFCNFYGTDYPFEVEMELVKKDISIETLRNVYYIMEVYVYEDNCQDRFHVLDENFDEAIIYNSEQCSGLLKLRINPKNDPIASNQYPKINYDNIEVVVSKEEQIYKLNQFFDITDDRGEFSKSGVGKVQRTIFKTQANGYIRDLNEANLNYNKSELEHKKFRHYKQNIILRKKISGNKNLILSMGLIKKLNSSR